MAGGDAAPSGRGGKRGRGAALGTMAAGAALLWIAFSGQSTPPQPPSSSGRDAGAAAIPALGRSLPLRIRIPTIDVDARSMTLGLDRGGTMQVPPWREADRIGWFAYSPTPGEAGAAVLAGHVDTPTGRSVLYDLGTLKPGAPVLVQRADGSTAVFTVDRVRAYTSATLPAKAVYTLTGPPTLRLITCGAGYDAATGHYRGNVVAYATLTSVREAPHRG